jgi:hypothetical protein
MKNQLIIRFLLKHLFSFRLWLVLIIGTFGLLFIWLIRIYIIASLIGSTEECASETHEISQNRIGNRVYVTDEGCDGGLAHSDVTSICIITADNRDRKIVFSYDSSYSGPEITWKSDKELVIKVHDVDYFRKKIKKYDGITIEYEIGDAKPSGGPLSFIFEMLHLAILDGCSKVTALFKYLSIR